MATTISGTTGVNNVTDATTQITTIANGYDLGVGQTWQDVKASRALGTTYTNSTGKPIMLVIGVASGSAAPDVTLFASINSGSNINFGSGNVNSGSAYCSGSIVVQAGATYKITLASGAIGSWWELR